MQKDRLQAWLKLGFYGCRAWARPEPVCPAWHPSWGPALRELPLGEELETPAPRPRGSARNCGPGRMDRGVCGQRVPGLNSSAC